MAYNSEQDFDKAYLDSTGVEYDPSKGFSKTYIGQDGQEHTISDADYAALSKLYSAKTRASLLDNTKNLLMENYNTSKALLDTNKQKGYENNYVTYQKLLKYLPQQLAAQGIGTSGASEGALIDAYNNYLTANGNVSSNYAKELSALDIGKNKELADLEEKRAGIIADGADNALEAYNTALKNDKIKKENEALELESEIQNYIDIGNYEAALTLLNAEENADLLSPSVKATYQKLIDDYNTTQKNEKAFAAYNVNTEGLSYSAAESNGAAISENLNVKDGVEQQNYVKQLLDESKNWENGTVANFNYGANDGDNKGNIFVLIDGTWYQTNYTNNNAPQNVITSKNIIQFQAYQKNDNAECKITPRKLQGMNLENGTAEIVINGTEFNLKFGELITEDETIKYLNKIATGDANAKPQNQICVLGNELYVCVSGAWSKTKDGDNNVNDVIQAYLSAGK